MAHIWKGDTFEGTIQLRQKAEDSEVSSAYIIPGGATIEIHFPAASNSFPVVLSTDNVGEITVIDDTVSTLTYKGGTTKSDLLKIGEEMSVDLIVINGSDKTTFVKAEILTVEARPNA